MARGTTILGLAVPSFWLGTLIVLLLMVGFEWFPPLRYVYPWDDLWSNLQQTILPAVVLGLFLAAYAARMTRSASLEVIREDYVRTARAKGLRELAVMFRHVLKNALLPVVTLSGVQFGALLSTSVVVEKVFNVPGLGRALVEAIAERDYMVIQNLVLTLEETAHAGCVGKDHRRISARVSGRRHGRQRRADRSGGRDRGQDPHGAERL